MGLGPSFLGRGGHNGPQHNFAVFAPTAMKFGTVIELDVLYTVHFLFTRIFQNRLCVFQ